MHDLYGEASLDPPCNRTLEAQLEQRTLNSKLSPRQLRRVTEFMEDNYARVIRLQELATLAGLSESYFCSAFKASTGVSPHAWQMQKRIDQAQILLRNQTCPYPISQLSRASPIRRISPVFSRN